MKIDQDPTLGTSGSGEQHGEDEHRRRPPPGIIRQEANGGFSLDAPSAELVADDDATTGTCTGRSTDGDNSGKTASRTAEERPRGNISTGETNVIVQSTFQAGDVRYYDITTTSVRLTWPKPADKKFPVYAYRISTREVGCGFEVAYSEAPSSSAGCIIVGLKPGQRYQFHIAPISLEQMLVPGASIVSDILSLPEATYERAWFFEGGDGDGPWVAFEGAGPDSIEEPGGGMWNAVSALDTVRCIVCEGRTAEDSGKYPERRNVDVES